jgi:ketosteroid isomerase-like protein
MPDNSSNEIQRLEAVSAAWDQALVSNNAEAIGRFMADDWVIVSDRGVTQKADFLAVVACGDLTHETFKGEISSARLFGDTAVLTGRVRNNGEYQGRPFNSDEWTTDVFVKRNDTWLCVHSHITTVKEG